MTSKLEHTASINKIEAENIKLKEILEKNYDNYIEIQEEVKNIYDEYSSLLSINEKIQLENMDQKKKIIELEEELNNINTLNKNLQEKNEILKQRVYAFKNSKLGKINVAYWNFRNKRKEK